MGTNLVAEALDWGLVVGFLDGGDFNVALGDPFGKNLDGAFNDAFDGGLGASDFKEGVLKGALEGAWDVALTELLEDPFDRNLGGGFA